MRPARLLKRLLIFTHRWLGVALSVLFLLWFASGIVMMYWTFPAVTAEDRLERLPSLEPERIKVSPEAAAAALGRDQPPAQVRLSSFDGRPVYRFGGGGRGDGGRRGGAMVYADDGQVADDVDEDMVDRAAGAWAGRPIREATKQSLEEVDQWTVAGGFRNQRPLYKYSFPDGQQVYINGNTAEVVQYTTTSSRFWAYLGAIPHWFYFTPLRKHQPQWFSFVVWSSLIRNDDTDQRRDRPAYYLDRRREAPLPVVYAKLNDSMKTRYYIDPKTARVVGNYSARNWVSRWLYHGLHSLDFPWLYNYRPPWDIVVITLMLGGTALCVTSLVLTWRVLTRRVAAVVRARFNTPNEDLIAET